MVRIGRIVLNEDLVVKVVSSKKDKTTYLYGSDGHLLASFKKHAAVAWNFFKSSADDAAVND